MSKLPDSREFLSMGIFGRPHGINGELILRWRGHNPPQRGMTLYQHDFEPLELKSIRTHKGQLLVSLAGVDDRTRAQTLTGQRVYLKRDALPPLENGEVYLADLIGSTVRLESGQALGILDHVEFPAGREVWFIKKPDGTEILFPARPELIADINLASGEVTVSPPDGLLDIYNA